ncbi:hypothetical protein D3C87_1602210 [compost metagenome]
MSRLRACEGTGWVRFHDCMNFTWAFFLLRVRQAFASSIESSEDGADEEIDDETAIRLASTLAPTSANMWPGRNANGYRYT